MFLYFIHYFLWLPFINGLSYKSNILKHKIEDISEHGETFPSSQQLSIAELQQFLICPFYSVTCSFPEGCCPLPIAEVPQGTEYWGEG
jgi:hypothetical protein